MSDPPADAQPRVEYRFPPYPQSQSQVSTQQMQASGGAGRYSAHPAYSAPDYPTCVSSSLPLPQLQGSHHLASAPLHFQAQAQPFDWNSGGGSARGMHLPPIRYQPPPQSHAQSHAQQPHHQPQPLPTPSILRDGPRSFAQPPHLAHADNGRRLYKTQALAGYRPPPRDSWQVHSRTHDPQGQGHDLGERLTHGSLGLSGDGTNRRWGGPDDSDAQSHSHSHAAASQVAKDDTDSEEDESGKKKRRRRRKASEVPRDFSQRKYSCQSCSKLFARYVPVLALPSVLFLTLWRDRPSALLTHGVRCRRELCNAGPADAPLVPSAPTANLNLFSVPLPRVAAASVLRLTSAATSVSA